MEVHFRVILHMGLVLQAKYGVHGARVTMINKKAHSSTLWQEMVMANPLLVWGLKVIVDNGDRLSSGQMVGLWIPL